MAEPAARLVLASASPRRADLLRAAGFVFEVRPSGAAEWAYEGGDPGTYAEALARAKACAVEGRPGEVVLGADTIVVVGGDVLGKPADAGEAAAMLRRLSGRRHDVVTGIAVRDDGGLRSAHARTGVWFRELTDAEIGAYVAGGEPMDKAGAYAYQGGAARFVTGLVGDADTVVGLPIRLVRALLAIS
jgi:septum formation protein